jgi:transcriptional regulator with XRE-family HTH domain
MIDIQDRIKAIRTENSLTQLEFSKQIDISRDNLAQIETKKSLPTISTIYNIVKIFNISFDWLITGNGKMIEEKNSEKTERKMDCDKLIEKLEKQLDRQEREIERLQKRIDELEKK